MDAKGLEMIVTAALISSVVGFAGMIVGLYMIVKGGNIFDNYANDRADKGYNV